LKEHSRPDPDAEDILVARFFGTPQGQEVMGILESRLGVRHTVEPAQEIYLTTGVYHPIDPVELYIRKGRRDAYYLIENSILRGKNAMEKGLSL
jgi:hypothetical protein